MVVSVRSFIGPVLIREEMADGRGSSDLHYAYRISNRSAPNYRTSNKTSQTYSTVGDINYSVELDKR